MRKLLAVLEQLGATTIAARALRERVGDDAVLAAARAAGIVKDAPPATTFECPGRGCARDVKRGKTRLLAACVHDPAECETVRVKSEDLEQVALSTDALEAVVQRFLAITARSAPPRAHEPKLLGEQLAGGAARDVFLALHPSRVAVAPFLSARERAARGTLCLVPTMDAVDPDLATRYAAGAHVELAVLADMLTVRDGAIALAPRLRLVRAPAPAPAPAPGPLRSRLPSYSSWSDLHFRLADGLTLLVSVGRATARVSYFDLGLANRNTREPRAGWRVLVAICEGNGRWQWTDFGDKDTVPQLVSELQKTLMNAFELRDKPFERMTRAHGYKPKFKASPGPGGRGGDADEHEGAWG